jgi:hypothetical protein
MGLFILRIALQDWCFVRDYRKKIVGEEIIYGTGKVNARN